MALKCKVLSVAAALQVATSVSEDYREQFKGLLSCEEVSEVKFQFTDSKSDSQVPTGVDRHSASVKRHFSQLSHYFVNS